MIFNIFVIAIEMQMIIISDELNTFNHVYR